MDECYGDCDPNEIYKLVMDNGVPIDYIEECHRDCKGIARVKARLHKDETTELLKRNGFQARDIDFVFSKELDDKRHAVQFVKKFIHSAGIDGKSLDKGNCLVLAGNTNTGKTIAAIYACAFHRMGAYLYSGDISERLRADSGFKKHCCETSFLVLDDYSGHEGDPHYNRFIDSMFHKRHGASLPMIITTNMSQVDFVKSLPARVKSRLSQERGGWAVFVEVS